MAEPIVSEEVKKFINNNPAQKTKIIEKIKLCLGEYLFVITKRCNKHELDGEFKGYYRLHLGDKNVAIYKISGVKPNRKAVVLKIMSEKVYHNWIKS